MTSDSTNKDFTTYMPIGFWSEVVSQMDSSVKNMALTQGFGEVSAKVVIKRGMVMDVVYGQENRVRHDEPPPPPKNEPKKG